MKMQYTSLTVALILISLGLYACENHERDKDGNRTSLSYSEKEFDNNLKLARQNCNQSDPEDKKQCLISYLGCSAVTGDVTCDD